MAKDCTPQPPLWTSNMTTNDNTLVSMSLVHHGSCVVQSVAILWCCRLGHLQDTIACSTLAIQDSIVPLSSMSRLKDLHAKTPAIVEGLQDCAPVSLWAAYAAVASAKLISAALHSTCLCKR